MPEVPPNDLRFFSVAATPRVVPIRLFRAVLDLRAPYLFDRMK
jgi:hypothetical protein